MPRLKLCNNLPIQYIRLETNRGLPVARNVGIRGSAGKYVAFLDDDDLWLPYKLTLQVPVLEAHPEIGVVYGQVIVKFGSNVSVRPEARNAPSVRVSRPAEEKFSGVL
jgi:glycosyltransferase involved in cell wall biosynthesis